MVQGALDTQGCNSDLVHWFAHGTTINVYELYRYKCTEFRSSVTMSILPRMIIWNTAYIEFIQWLPEGALMNEKFEGG